MKNNIRKILTAALALTLTFSLTACGGAAKKEIKTDAVATTQTSEETAQAPEQAANTVIKVGANITPHSEILEQAKPILEQKGITLEIVKLEDSITPNTGVIEGSLDANYF